MRTEVKWRSVAMCEHQWQPCHGGAWPCSSVTEAPSPVMSSRERQGEKGNAGQESDEREERSAALATKDHEGSSASVSSEWGKASNAPLPWLGCSKGGVDEVREVVAELWAWCSGRWCGGERAWPWGSARR
jgi:hypothetical protein